MTTNNLVTSAVEIELRHVLRLCGLRHDTLESLRRKLEWTYEELHLVSKGLPPTTETPEEVAAIAMLPVGILYRLVCRCMKGESGGQVPADSDSAGGQAGKDPVALPLHDDMDSGSGVAVNAVDPETESDDPRCC